MAHVGDVDEQGVKALGLISAGIDILDVMVPEVTRPGDEDEPYALLGFKCALGVGDPAVV